MIFSEGRIPRFTNGGFVCSLYVELMIVKVMVMVKDDYTNVVDTGEKFLTVTNATSSTYFGFSEALK
jgi:hypothetical protein